MRGQEYVIVAARTRLRLPAAAEARGFVQMLQDFGRATFRIEKKATPHFGVRTPYLVALVKGTTFTVTADGNGAAVAVTEGRVEVSSPDGAVRQLVDAGMAASIASAQPARIELQPVAAGGASAQAVRGCGDDGARGCGPKLDYEPVEVADTLSTPDTGGASPAGPTVLAERVANTPHTAALLNLGASTPAAPAPPPAPAPAADPNPTPTPAAPALRRRPLRLPPPRPHPPLLQRRHRHRRLPRQ